VSAAGEVIPVPVPTGDALDGPASMAITDWDGVRSVLTTSSAFFSVGVEGASPRPSVTSFGPL